MRRQVRRRPQPAIDHLSVHIGHHHVGGSQRRVVDPAGLDHHQPAMAIDAAGVAEGEQNQSLANQLQIRLEYLLLQRVQGTDVARRLLGGIGHRS